VYVYVPKEFKDVCTAAPGEGERGSVILEILAKGVPVTALLVLVAAAGGGGSRRGIGASNQAVAGGVHGGCCGGGDVSVTRLHKFLN